MVVAPTPLPGGGVDPDTLPSVVESLASVDVQRTNSLAVTDALEQRLAGASLGDAQGNRFTRDFNFRGFQASPLQGTPQGFAVYMGGVRLNEAFGDTVNWDRIPEVAIARVDLFTANPAFGLNALGGAVTLRMKSGFDSVGGSAMAQRGSFRRSFGSVEQAFASGPWALYVAADGGHERGWRLHSPSSIARAYGDLGWKKGPVETHLVVAGASNNFGVVGPTPIDLFEADRRCVFTFPQRTRNNTGLMALSGSYAPSGSWSLQGDVYARRFNQHHVDGNGGDFEGCSGQANTLCVNDEAFPLQSDPPTTAFQVQTLSGTPIACPPTGIGQSGACAGIPYGSIDRTRTDAGAVGASLQVSRNAELFGRSNAFAVGAGVDDSRAHFSSGRLSLTFSGRINWARVAMRDLTGVSPELNGKHDFTRFNPAAGLAYRVMDTVTAYGGYSAASRVPTSLELGCSDRLRPCLLENALVADPPLRQVTARTWEAGLRGAPHFTGGVLRWRAGVFQANNRNDIVALASSIQGRGYYANVPRTRRRGLEASAEYNSGSAMLYVGLSHIEASHRFSRDLPSPNSPFADEDGDIRVDPGDRIGGIPSTRSKFGGDIAVSSRLSIGADAVAVGPQHLVGDEGNADARLRGYWTSIIHANWRVNSRFEVFGRVDNLLNSRRATYGTCFEVDALENLRPSPLSDDPDPRTVTPLTARAIQVGVRARW